MSGVLRRMGVQSNYKNNRNKLQKHIHRYYKKIQIIKVGSSRKLGQPPTHIHIHVQLNRGRAQILPSMGFRFTQTPTTLHVRILSKTRGPQVQSGSLLEHLDAATYSCRVPMWQVVSCGRKGGVK